MGIKSWQEIIQWLLFRLPLSFSIPFSLGSLLWLAKGYDLWFKSSFYFLIKNWVFGWVDAFLLSFYSIQSLVDSLIDIFFIIGGLLVMYNLSVLIHHISELLKSKLFPRRYKIVTNYLQKPKQESTETDKNINNDTDGIGIILAGGGAKGAYQAGALRAIYNYLNRKNLLHKVKMIAGTSIGSWNALFWIAGLVGTEKEKDKGFQQMWWESMNSKSLVAPNYYLPFIKNSFLSTVPWENQFDEIFNQPQVRDAIINSPIHFYFTRTNIGSGELEFITNNPGTPDLGIPMKPLTENNPWDYFDNKKYIKEKYFEVANRENPSQFMKTIKEGVFASMDLPPLFPYRKAGYEFFEDGGVVDNLPIYFGLTVESCKYLFVIPLNSDFEQEKVNTTSMVARLSRVMTIRQGALERNAIRMLDLYNALAEMREKSYHYRAELDRLKKENNWSEDDWYADDTYGQTDSWFMDNNEWSWENNEPLKSNFAKKTGMFAICPERPLIIDTAHLWKTKEAGEAFDVMYQATRDKLTEDPLRDFDYYDQFDFKISLHLVSRNKNVKTDTDI